MYEKILVPLDGSELAEVTLYYATGLAGALRSSLTLLFIADPIDLGSRHMYEAYLKETSVRVKIRKVD